MAYKPISHCDIFFFLLLFTDLLRTTDLKPLLPCQQSGYREYYPSRNKTHLYVQSEQKDAVGMDSAIYSKKSARFFIFLTKYQSLLFFLDKPLFLTATVHNSTGATRKKKETKTYKPPPQPASLENKSKLLLILNSFVSDATHWRPHPRVWRRLHLRKHTCILGFFFLVCEYQKGGFPPVLLLLSLNLTLTSLHFGIFLLLCL